MFNKAFLMFMDDGREVVAKVPNPNAGIPHFTTASEVATMDFVSLSWTPPAMSFANVTDLGGQKNSWHTGTSCLFMELTSKFTPCWGWVHHHG